MAARSALIDPDVSVTNKMSTFSTAVAAGCWNPMLPVLSGFTVSHGGFSHKTTGGTLLEEFLKLTSLQFWKSTRTVNDEMKTANFFTRSPRVKCSLNLGDISHQTYICAKGGPVEMGSQIQSNSPSVNIVSN